ncbi:group I truncated hemoglobin [Haladaptatus sp. DFWS20]|uniref:group I truncated hemoglobin n=1 Tax=Haladaptatus sp. DFWS20 TaxID=3403467 RepID=UPI003EBBFF64
MSQSVYGEIGGRDAVEAVVTDFYDRVLSDDQLIPYFEGMDMDELRAHQIQFISAVAGGPVEYSGADMREAHIHLDIDEADFEAVGTHLETALRTNGVGEDNIDAIMAEVVALKDPILDR